MTTKNYSNMIVFAGGYDCEMKEIINICREADVKVVDKHLGLGASVSAYAEEIAQAASGADMQTKIWL